MNKVITIGRQFATGGSEIGSTLSSMTGIPCYDKDKLITMAQNLGIPSEMFEKADEQATSSFLYSLAMSSYNGGIAHYGMTEHILTDRVFNIQSEEMKKIAKNGDGIFIGRCADDVLSEFDGVLKIFLHAPIEYRIQVLKKHGVSDENAARKQIQKADKKRASYYNFYTGKGWGDPKNYHLNIDCSLLGIEGTAELIKSVIEKFYK